MGVEEAEREKINVKYRLRLGSVPAGWEVGPGSRTDPVIDPQVGFGSWDSRMDTGVQLRKGEGTMMMRLKDENSVKRWGEMFVSIFFVMFKYNILDVLSEIYNFD